jgi:hypothetical protein
MTRLTSSAWTAYRHQVYQKTLKSHDGLNIPFTFVYCMGLKVTPPALTFGSKCWSTCRAWPISVHSFFPFPSSFPYLRRRMICIPLSCRSSPSFLIWTQCGYVANPKNLSIHYQPIGASPRPDPYDTFLWFILYVTHSDSLHSYLWLT